MNDDRSRLLLRFSRTGVGRFLSHRDTLRALERALRRAALPVAFSQGFSPHPRMSFPVALATGQAGLDEPAIVEFDGATPPDRVRETLNKLLPLGLRIESVQSAPAASQMRVEALEYGFQAAENETFDAARVQALRERPEWRVTRAARASAKSAAPRSLDLKPWLHGLDQTGPSTLRWCTLVEQGMAIRPEEMLEALGAAIRPGAWEITRRRVLLTPQWQAPASSA